MGLVLISPKKVIIEKSLRLGFSATNNEAEYEALMMGMVMVQRNGWKISKNLLGIKARRRPSKRGIRGKR